MQSRSTNPMYNLFDFLLTKTYPIEALEKEGKKEHGVTRVFSFSFLTAVFSYAGAIGGLILGSHGGFTLGFGMGAALGTLIFPGVGTSIGATIGAVAGTLGGAIFGWKAGIETLGFIGATIAKHATRIVSAIFNHSEVNPTNPNKFKLTEENIKDINVSRIHKSLHDHKPTSSNDHWHSPKRTAPEAIKHINAALKDCNDWKWKTKGILAKLTGITFFMKPEDHSTKDSINAVIKDLKSGATASYEDLRPKFASHKK